MCYFIPNCAVVQEIICYVKFLTHIVWTKTNESLYTMSFSHQLNVQSEGSGVTSHVQVLFVNIFTVM